jgi:hypothetical protein
VAGELAAGRVERLRVAATPATIRTVLAPFIATLRPDEPVLLSVAAAHFVIYERLHQDADLVARRRRRTRFCTSPTPLCVASQASSSCERAHGGVNEDHRMTGTAPGEREVDRSATWSGRTHRAACRSARWSLNIVRRVSPWLGPVAARSLPFGM